MKENKSQVKRAYWMGKNKDLTLEVLESVHRQTHPHQYFSTDETKKWSAFSTIDISYRQ